MADLEGYGVPGAGGGVNKTNNMPECTAKYWPSLGGTVGENIEGGGETGAKDVGEIGAEPANPQDGDFNTVVNSFPPGIPHGPEDVPLGGPPLAYTPEDDPTRSMY